MKKILMMILIIGAVVLTACEKNEPKLPGNACTLEYAPVCGVDGITYGNKCMAGNTQIAYLGECAKANASYRVAEILNNSCSEDRDCKTPGRYLVMSSCPYTSKCLDNKCTVVCPQFNGTAYPEVKEKNISNESKVQIANPASEFCIAHSGELEIKSAADGSQTGYCTINGIECEEWALMRGECSKMHICTLEEQNAQACTMEYLPVCGSTGQTYGNKCTACASSIEYYTPGEC